MSIVKGTTSDISEDFLNKLEKTFTVDKVYNHGDSAADCAYKQGQRDVVEWIRQHANRASFT